MSIPDAAIEAAADGLAQWCFGLDAQGVRCDGCMKQARAAIEAAMPAIREAIAQELRDHMRMLSGSYRDGWSAAANRVEKGGTQ
jgi:hypothetical protein